VLFTPTTTGAEVVQINAFYPYGMRIEALSWHNPLYNQNRYLREGKEFISDHSWNKHDYGARFFDLTGVIPLSLDPLCELKPWLSPYHLFSGNPVSRIDPTGMLDDWYLNLDNGIVEHREGSENRFREGLVHLAKDNATVGDIEDALTERNYEYRKLVDGRFRVDTEKQYKGWAMMMQVDAMLTIIGLGSMPAKMPQSKVSTSGMYNAGKKAIETAVEMGYNLLDDAAQLIKLNGEKNSVTIHTATQVIRYDLAGKAHGGVATPHMQVYTKNFVDGVLRSISRASKEAIPMTQKEMEVVRAFLTGQ
jgi:hypothetical protein